MAVRVRTRTGTVPTGRNVMWLVKRGCSPVVVNSNEPTRADSAMVDSSREVLTDAGTGAAAEREPRVAVPGLPLRGEPSRVEAPGIVPEARVPVRHPRRDDDVRARRDAVPADLIVRAAAPAGERSRREQPHGLLEHHRRVRLVGVSRLRSHPLLGVRVAGEQVEGVRQRGRGGLVSGQHEDEHLVADLGVAEGGAVVAGGQQHTEQIRLPGAPGAAVGDDPVAHVEQLAAGAVEPPVRRRRPAARWAYGCGRALAHRLAERSEPTSWLVRTTSP